MIIVAIAVGGSGAAVATGVVVGAVVLVVSMLTKYPLGVKKVLPFTIHSAGDYLAAALLLIAPFALNFHDTDAGLTAFYIVAGIAVLAVSLHHELPVQREARLERSDAGNGVARTNFIPATSPKAPGTDAGGL